jgi:opacity protein-like surface antigen
MKKEDWTNQLRDKMNDYQEPAPDDLWSGIEHALTTDENAVRHARIVSMRRWISVAAVCLFMIVGGTYLLLTKPEGRQTAETIKKDTKPTSINHINTRTNRNNNDIAMISHSGKMADNNDASLQKSYKKSTSLSARHDGDVMPSVNGSVRVSAIAEPGTSRMSEDTSGTVIAENRTPKSETKADQEQSVVVSKRPETERHADGEMYADYEINPHERHASGAWSGSLYAMNVVNSMNNGSINSSPMLMSDALASNLSEMFCDGNAASNEQNTVYLNNYAEKYKHKLPVVVGLSIRYNLDDRWSVESGLTYSKVQSEFTHIINENTIEDEQNLYYVGVPLKMNYQLWGNRYFSAYATAGGAMDVCVSAKQTTTGIESNIKKDRPQFSLNTSVGVQYNILPTFGVYLEPGLKYYIDNGSNVQNIFKDKPCNFSLLIGLRYTIKH